MRIPLKAARRLMGRMADALDVSPRPARDSDLTCRSWWWSRPGARATLAIAGILSLWPGSIGSRGTLGKSPVGYLSGWVQSGRQRSEKAGARARGEEEIVGELGGPPVALDPVEAVQDDLPEQRAELEGVA